ncbi:MAG: hypothetical protein GX175_09705 [Halanaerobiaceae bacterium]|nr:hypothetical protein [Halanaerobiaceae bacterium]
MAKVRDREDCPNIAINEEECTCSYSCPRHGLCCACVEYHRKNGGIPGCLKNN